MAYHIQTLITTVIPNHHHSAKVYIHVSKREKIYLQILGETLSTDRDRWKKACCSAAVSARPWHPHAAAAPLLQEYSQRSTESSRRKRRCFTTPSKFSSRMQPQRASQALEAISNCIAFWNVLGNLLLLLPQVPSVEAPHDCSVLQNAVEGDSRRDTETLKHLGFPVILVSRQ